MSDKLEFKDIVGYLPYGLVVQIDSLDGKLFQVRQNGLQFELVDVLTGIKTVVPDKFTFSDIKPVLIHRYNLYLEIEYNKEKIIPLMELAKRHFPKNNCEYQESQLKWFKETYEKDAPEFVDVICVFIKDVGHFYYKVHFYEGKYETNFLIKHDVMKVKEYRNGSAGSYLGEEDVRIYNVHELYEHLYELKIDFKNLIGKGLAIDANTLKLNPYA